MAEKKKGVEWDNKIGGPVIHIPSQTHVEAGKKAAATRKRNKEAAEAASDEAAPSVE